MVGKFCAEALMQWQQYLFFSHWNDNFQKTWSCRVDFGCIHFEVTMLKKREKKKWWKHLKTATYQKCFHYPASISYWFTYLFIF